MIFKKKYIILNKEQINKYVKMEEKLLSIYYCFWDSILKYDNDNWFKTQYLVYNWSCHLWKLLT